MRTFLLFLTMTLTLIAEASSPYRLYVGEESYFFWRNREGGTKQDGRMDGGRITLERFKKNGWYLGGDYLYATGRLSGQTARKTSLSSQLTDQVFEVRLGYTLYKHSLNAPFFTPFVGWGSFKEENNFHPPSPLSYTFTDTYNFVVVGFLSGLNWTPLLSMEINFKVRFMQDAQSKVTEDPLFEDVTLMIENETSYRLEIPFTYTPCCYSFLGVGGQLAPFYEFRHFGGREGYPFNFKDTKFHLLGLRLSLVYRF